MYGGTRELRQINPRQTAGWLSFLTFGYTIQLFRKGFKGHLQESDIYEVTKCCSSKKCGDKIDGTWKHCRSSLHLLFKTFGKKYFLYTSIHLTWHLISSTIQPYAMSRFISYFDTNQTHLSRSDAYYYGGIVIFLSIFRSLWIHNYFMLECILGVQIRSSLTSLIYRKVLKLRPGEARRSNVGNTITVLTKDIRTIETTIWPLSDMIIGLVKFCYLTYLLYARIGTPSHFVTGVMTVAIAIQVILSKFIMKLRLRAGKMADKRLHITKELLSALKIIKMYTWEKFFHAKVCKARKKETQANLRGWYLGTTIFAFGSFIAKLIFPIFLLAYRSLGHSTNTELVYYLMSLFKEYAGVIGSNIPNGIGLSAEFYAAVVRIGRILNMIEEVDFNLETPLKDIAAKETKVVLQNVSVRFDSNTILDGINLNIDKHGLYAITGPLGSGKSSILKVVLKEYPIFNGNIQISGTVSYAAQDPWLFPASVRQNILFGEAFDETRYDRVIEVCSLEHDFMVLPNGDNTLISDGGLNVSKGQRTRIHLARAIYKESDIYLLDDPLACLDVKVQDYIFKNCIREFLKQKLVIFVTQNYNQVQDVEKLIAVEEGQIKTIVEPEKRTVNATTFKKVIESSTQELKEYERQPNNIYHEEKNINSVDMTNYYRYVKYGGGMVIFSILIFVFFGAQLTESYTDKLISIWVDYQQANQSIYLNSTSEDPQFLQDTTFELYIMMCVLSSLIDLVKSYWFLVYCRRASINFHKHMSHSIINSTITFLDRHFIGNILNRFSYDLDLIDEVFPFLFKDLLSGFFAIGGTLILIITVDWVFLFIFMLFFITLMLLRRFYIPTARALKRLAAITRSPFIGHLNATVEGLSTIKAFKAENLLKDEFDKHQDLAISVVYMEITTARAFGYVLDFACSIFISMVVLTFLLINPDTSVGNVGLVLTQVIAMSHHLQGIVRVWTSIEQCMTSVERVIEYIEIPQENKCGEKPINWPKSGKIDYQHVNLIYNFDSKVLKDVSFTIQCGDKIAIVGRTGAGKSSIVSTLFRLYEYQGEIQIDGIKANEISLDLLRKSISIIPQDPITFEGSVRENVDPMGTSLDTDIWKLLKNVTLDHIVPNLDENLVNLNLSTGQKQLLCLARILLKNNKIVILDEPTANLDVEIEKLVYDLLGHYFADRTLIVVTHRLPFTLSCDKVMVMEDGRLVEFDNPHLLLHNKGSLFYQMFNVQ